MTIAEVRDKVQRIRNGFQDEVLKCMGDNGNEMVVSVREQLYSGVDGNNVPLSPKYSEDPYFQRKGAGYYDEQRSMWVPCYQHPERYAEWKRRITPPEASDRLNLPARDWDTPNLFIVGTFHSSISARATTRGVEIFTFGWDEGPAVERKYGSQIFALSDPAVAHFNENFLWPWLKAWIETV